MGMSQISVPGLLGPVRTGILRRSQSHPLKGESAAAELRLRGRLGPRHWESAERNTRGRMEQRSVREPKKTPILRGEMLGGFILPHLKHSLCDSLLPPQLCWEKSWKKAQRETCPALSLAVSKMP